MERKLTGKLTLYVPVHNVRQSNAAATLRATLLKVYGGFTVTRAGGVWDSGGSVFHEAVDVITVLLVVGTENEAIEALHRYGVEAGEMKVCWELQRTLGCIEQSVAYTVTQGEVA